MSVKGSKGTLIAVAAAAPATYNQAGYEALTFTNVGFVSTIGEFGPSYEQGQFDPLGAESRVYFKGIRDDGELSLDIGHILTDGGQDILEAAAEDNGGTLSDVSVRITMNTGRVYYDRMTVFSFRHVPGQGTDAIIVRVVMRPTSGLPPVKVDS